MRTAPGSSSASSPASSPSGGTTGLPRHSLGLMAVAVVAVSFSGPLMAGLVVPALAISFWRNAMATAVLAPVALGPRRSDLTGLTRAQVVPILVAGVALAAHFGLWVTSLGLTSVASSTAIVCLQVVWVVAWDATLSRTRVRLPVRALVGIAVAVAGTLVVTGVDVSLSTRALVGDLLALAGGVSVAAYTVIGGHARRSVSTTAYTFLVYGTAAVVLLAAAAVAGQRLGGYAADQWVLLGVVTLSAQLLGHSVLNHLLAHVSPRLVSLLLLLEIPGAALVAALLLGQVPPALAFVGLGLVLLGMVLVVANGPDAPGEAPPT